MNIELTFKDGIKVDIEYPISFNDVNGNETYYEDSEGWTKYKYDANGNLLCSEDSNDNWLKNEYDDNGVCTYWENASGDTYGIKAIK